MNQLHSLTEREGYLRETALGFYGTGWIGVNRVGEQQNLNHTYDRRIGSIGSYDTQFTIFELNNFHALWLSTLVLDSL